MEVAILNPEIRSGSMYVNSLKGCFHLSKILRKLKNSKYQQFFKLLILIKLINQKNIFGHNLKFTKLINSFIKLLNSKYLPVLKLSLNSIFNHKLQKFSKNDWKSKTQKKKLMMKYVQEMILRGRINLEQRGFWRWVTRIRLNNKPVHKTESKHLVSLKLLFYNSKIRYFQELKKKILRIFKKFQNKVNHKQNWKIWKKSEFSHKFVELDKKKYSIFFYPNKNLFTKQIQAASIQKNMHKALYSKFNSHF